MEELKTIKLSKSQIKNQKRRQKVKHDKSNSKIPTIYCISLESRPDRRQRMEHRFKVGGLLNNVFFIDATAAGDPLIDKYAPEKMPRGIKQLGPDFTLNYDAVYGCFISHLRALKACVDSKESEAIIIEDDVMLRDTFCTDFPLVHCNVPAETGLVHLSYMLRNNTYSVGGIDVTKKNLLKMNSSTTWGTQMYLIRRDYAIECLSKWDKPFDLLTSIPLEERTSELITRTNGLMAFPVLGIEESIVKEYEKSSIRSNVQYNIDSFSTWDIESFQKGEMKESV